MRWAPINRMVDVDSAMSNQDTAFPQDLTSVFETLADWEYQIKQLPLADRRCLEEILGEPSL